MALVVVVSMVAVGGIATQPAAADHTGEFPAGVDDLDSDEFLVDANAEDGEVNESDQLFEEIAPAVEEAAGSYTVYVAEGDYSENAVVDTNIDLIGEGEGDDQGDGVRIEAADPAEPALDVQTDSLTVTHMTIVGGDGPAVLLSGSSGTDNIKNLDFQQNIVVAGDGGTGLEAVSMSMDPADGNELTDNTFTVAPDASAEALAYIAGGSVGEGEQPAGYTVADNTFTTAVAGDTDGTTGISLHLESDNAVVENNQFPSEGAGEGAAYDVAVAGDDNTVENNDLDSAGFADGLFLAGEGVSATGNDIDGADGNGVLVADGAADVTIDGNDVSNSGAWGVNAGSVADLDVTANTLDANLGGVIAAGGSDVTVSENDIDDNEVEGVSVSGSETVAVSDNDVDASGDGVAGAGIDVADASDVSVAGNDVTNNDDGGIGLSAIGAGAAVEDNAVTGSGSGISAADVAGGLTVAANDVTENDDGVDVTNVTGDLDVTDNLVDANDDDGVTVDAVTEGDTTVTANDVTDNEDPSPEATTHGVYVTGVGALDVSDNVVENNDLNGVLITDAGDITVADNEVSDHDAVGLTVIEAGDVDATGNDVEDSGDGLDVSNAANVTAESNAVSDSGSGIGVSDAADVDATENEVSGSGDGVTVSAAADVAVDSNDVTDVDEQAIGVSDVAAAMVEANVVESAGDGIAVSGAAVDASVTDNEVSEVGTGIAVDAAGTDEPVDVERNVLDAYDTGIHFEAFDETQPPFAAYNDLLDEEAVDVANDGPATVEALFNYYDTDADVSHSDVDENAAFEGDVLYDPFLTVPQSDVSVQEPENTQKFGHELTLEATPDTTDPQVVAFPASVDGTVEEVFSDLPAGASVYAYDASEDEFVPGGDMANESIGALDAFVVTDLDEDATVAFEYPSDGTASPGEKDLEEGWNLVGAPKKTTVSTAFSSVLNGEETQVNHLYGDAVDQPDFVDETTAQRNGEPLWFESVEDASGEDPTFNVLGNEDGDQIVSPYTGYWVSVDSVEDGSTVTGTLPDSGADAIQEVEALETDDSEDEAE